MDTSRYKGIYLQEAKAHLSDIESGLLSLERDPSGKETLDSLFRHYHSIKGMSASMGYTPIMRLAHAEEDLLDKLREGKLGLTEAMTSALLKCLDVKRELVGKVENNEPLDISIDPFIDELTAASKAGPSQAHPGPAAANLPGIPPAHAGGLRLSNVMRVEGRVFDELLATVGDLFMVLSSFKALTLESRSIELKDGVHMLGKTVGSLHGSILSARMLPIEDLAAGIPRIIRDLTAGSGKEVSLYTEGMDISLDRAILEGLSSPLVHIIRNAIDHGIEPASERIANGKLSIGSIRVRAHARKDRAVIEVSDDGRGIRKEALRKKAAERGVPLEKTAAMPDKELLKLVCLPGLSTAGKVSETSGRGVGMDVVKDAIEGLGGTLDIESEEGRGTKVILELPRTTLITKALIVGIGPERFLIPISRIEKVIEADTGAEDVFSYEGASVPIVSLAPLFGLPERDGRSHTLVLVDGSPVLGQNGESPLAALRVDGFGAEIDAYVKPLLPPISKLWGASGMTMMVDGSPVFLLDVQQLISRSLERAI
ncbi:MAG: Hpt domain-containing protein [Deltaproteobacteria bacterium]|nr:Hpt domain-containing protein [Deltaproteobacteria bacterium]MCL4873698.1 Hpt domain-containing protein [bacterium]